MTTLYRHYFIDRKCDVVNRGFCGYTSAFNKLILPKILKCDNNPKGSIVAVTVLLGSNDSVLESVDSRGLTVEQYIENINNIVLQFINDGIPASQVVLLTPPAVSIEMYTKYCKEMGKRVFFSSINTAGISVPEPCSNLLGRTMSLSAERVKLFAEKCTALGKKLGVDVVDLHSLFHSQPVRQNVLTFRFCRWC